MGLEFEWDPRKAEANLAKHDESFHEAKTVFGDPRAITIDDPDHSGGEFRQLIVGRSAEGHLLVLSFTLRTPRIRLISARRANLRERRQYEGR
jgi:uncharacterized DUF497 family protein